MSTLTLLATPFVYGYFALEALLEVQSTANTQLTRASRLPISTVIASVGWGIAVLLGLVTWLKLGLALLLPGQSASLTSHLMPTFTTVGEAYRRYTGQMKAQRKKIASAVSAAQGTLTKISKVA